MSQPLDDRSDDLFRPPLEEIINLRHPLMRLAAEMDWDFLRQDALGRSVGSGQVNRRCRRDWRPGCSFVHSQAHAQSLRRGTVRPVGATGTRRGLTVKTQLAICDLLSAGFINTIGQRQSIIQSGERWKDPNSGW
jgi:hypothetical protein